jgi:acyl-CoA reductase-like NAD-dependent aldehyde dehydrogenase
MLRAAGMPENVFNVAVGARETGETLVDEVDFVMFTGSTRTGQAIAERAARRLIPVSLELGGKDAMIVCADADVDRAANAAAYYGLNNAGQVCLSIERVYVEAPLYDDFLRRLVDNVSRLRQGGPSAPGTVEIGAVTNPPQVEIVDAHVRDAREKGAQILTGGKLRAGTGRFYEPTVIAGADHTMACMREETFGPTIPVMKVRDSDEAVRLANDSPYGLQGSVFSRDHGKAEAIARRMECGAVCINDAQVNYTVFDAPMGGWKSSGLGSRHGSTGIRKYCRVQTVLGSAPPLKRDLHMFPYTPRRSRVMAALVRRLYGR